MDHRELPAQPSLTRAATLQAEIREFENHGTLAQRPAALLVSYAVRLGLMCADRPLFCSPDRDVLAQRVKIAPSQPPPTDLGAT